ncbi:DUF1593 domain-containing protein [Stieleria marina]|uniref:DUF1593 domain-containing protein n=1 Tax=Stieleria marina TaxID=1930275 RepID=UPI003AF33465
MIRTFAILLLLLASSSVNAAQPRPRLLVLTDIGGDPDDQQSLVRLMVYANAFQTEGIIATASGTPGELKTAVVRPDLIRAIVAAYGEVRPKLQRHEDRWPTADQLFAKIKSGNPHRGRDHIGEGHDTEGSRWIIQQVDAGTEKKLLNIAIWGGQTDLAQALWRVKRDRGEKGLAQFVKRFRVYDIADQDGIGDWMYSEFPGMFYIVSKAAKGTDKRDASFRGMYYGGDESLTSRDWIEQNVRSAGPLGALYPIKTWTAPNPHGCMKEGDTPSWFFFLPRGGNVPADPTQPGWGGQFRKALDGRYRDDDLGGDVARKSVSHWRADFQNDFRKRIAWCR